MRSRSLIGLMVLIGGFSASSLVLSQAKKPALIRDTEKAEGKEESEETKEKPFNPHEAEKSLKIGDFYFKKKNYEAAIQRYLEAIQYQPTLVAGYEALGRAYERNGEGEKAATVYKDFIQKNPSSPRVTDFQSKIQRLTKQ